MAANRYFSDRPADSRPGNSTNKPHISEKARQRPVRVLPADDRAEMEAGHLINSGNPYSSNMARPDTEVREGYGGSGFGDSNALESEADDTNSGAIGGSFSGFGDSSSADGGR